MEIMKKRSTEIKRNYLSHPDGSVLIKTGNTKVICSVTMQQGVPGFLNEEKEGWLTAEYSMLPGSTNTRKARAVKKGKISGRTAEIQRLIGRSLRAVVDRNKFPGYTVMIDCDVIEADGGTRTAAITGAMVGLYDAFQKLVKTGSITRNPIKEFAAAISVGIIDKKFVIDLDYELDSHAAVDMNLVMTESNKFIEIQGTAEAEPFNADDLNKMLALAKEGIQELIFEQKRALNLI